MENNEATAKAEFCQRVLSGDVEWMAATIWLDGLTIEEAKRIYDDCIVYNAVEPMFGGNISHRRQRIAEYLKPRIENSKQPQSDSRKDDEIRGVVNIAEYLGMSKSACQRALKMREIPGTWQDGSRWKMSISKYESLKYNKQ